MISEVTQNPFLKKDHALQRTRLLQEFPQLAACPTDTYLSLSKYIQCSPWTFYHRETFRTLLDWLETQDTKDRTSLQAYVTDNVNHINAALHNLDEVNRYEWHDLLIPPDDMDVVRFLDQTIHPSYVRLCESVWTPLLRMAAHITE